MTRPEVPPAVHREASRLLYIDNLRVLLIILVVLVHLAITYGAPGAWYYHEFAENPPGSGATIVFTLFVVVNQAFFMGLFFFLSGYFTPGSYDRKGGAAFLKDRLLRLGIPVLIYMTVLSPVLHCFLAAAEKGGLPWDAVPGRYLLALRDLDIGPLWFLETLFFFTIGYIAYRALEKKPEAGRIKAPGMPGNAGLLGLALLTGLATFLVRIWLPVGWVFKPLNLQFPFFPQYLCMFFLGVAAYRCHWLDRLSDETGKAWQIFTAGLLLSLPVLFVSIGGLEGDVSPALGGFHWQALAYAFWEQFVCAGMVISLPVLFRKKFNRQGKLAGAMSAGAYSVFILHAPLLVGLALALRDFSLPPLLKFVLVAPLAVAVCFVTAGLVRRIPLAGKVL